MGAVIAIAIVLAIIAVAIWSSRTKDTGTNGDNSESANRYGGGYHL